MRITVYGYLTTSDLDPPVRELCKIYACINIRHTFKNLVSFNDLFEHDFLMMHSIATRRSHILERHSDKHRTKIINNRRL